MTSFALSGNSSLGSIGQTSKLTATGHFADGSERDVSANMLWSTDVPNVVTISRDGLVTAIGLGVTTIFVTQQPVFQSVVLSVTPPGTTAVGGWVREPGGGPLPGVLVTEADSALSTATALSGDGLGTFAIGGLTNGHLKLTRDLFEDAHVDVSETGLLTVPLQRIIRVAAGGSVSSLIAPHDMDYLVAADTHCGPCRLIRVTGAGATLHFRLTWTDHASMLNVWINGQMFAGNADALDVESDAPGGPGELLVYVARVGATLPQSHTTFTFSTTR